MSKKSEFVQTIYQAGLDAGLTDAAARVMAAQAAHESGYGESAPGFNYFGIKAGKDWTGKTNSLATTEVENGKKVKTSAKFRAYESPEEAIADRIAFMADKFSGFNSAPDVGAALDALQNGKFGKYYTDDPSVYEGAINSINANYLGGKPVPPGKIPGGGQGEASLPVLRRGAKGDDVYGLQSLLDSAGFSPGTIDGDFGPRTEKALREYQKAHGLSVDGIAGPETYGSFERGGRTSGVPEGAMYGVRAPGTYKPGDQMAPATEEELAGLVPVDERMMGMRGAKEWKALPAPAPLAPRDLRTNPLMPETAVATALDTGVAPRGQVRLASGKTIAPGVYPGSDGRQVRVSDDGTGNAKVERLHGPGFVPGVMDPMREMNADTVVGGVIRRSAPAIVAKEVPKAANELIGGAKEAAEALAGKGSEAAQALAPLAGALPGGQLLGLAGGLWGAMTGAGPGPQQTPPPVATPETRLLSLVAPRPRARPIEPGPSAADANRARQIAEGKEALLDDFGMIRQ